MENKLAEIIGSILGLVLLFVALKGYNLIKRYFEEKSLNNFILAVVKGVEQMGKNLGWDGPEKKERALIKIQTWLGERGIDIPYDLMDLLLEAAVRTMKEADPFGFEVVEDKGSLLEAEVS
jgi:hypothetical protein